MDIFLAQFSNTLPTDVHVMPLLDQAGWRGKAALQLPGIITPLPLPPCAGAQSGGAGLVVLTGTLPVVSPAPRRGSHRGRALYRLDASHFLTRFTAPGRRNLIYLIKQTGVPFGDALAGRLAPSLAQSFD